MFIGRTGISQNKEEDGAGVDRQEEKDYEQRSDAVFVVLSNSV